MKFYGTYKHLLFTMKNLTLALLFIVLSLSNAFSMQLPDLNDQNVFHNDISRRSWKGQQINTSPESNDIQNHLLNNNEAQNIRTLVPWNAGNNIVNQNELQTLLQNHNGCCAFYYRWKQSSQIRSLLNVNLNQNQDIISRYLVNLINSDVNNIHTLRKVLGFQYIIYKTPYTTTTTNQSFWNINDMQNEFLTGSPRAQQRVLNKRELLRFKDIFTNQAQNNQLTPMISHSNFQNDDVIRAMSICGTFCTFDGSDYEPSFSGMLVPGQAYNQNSFNVHSCLHGFAGEQINQLYFVPYGLDLYDDNAFPLQEVWTNNVLTGVRNQVQQHDLDAMNNVYNQRDYAEGVVSNISAGNRSLRDVLDDRQANNLLNQNNLFPNFPVINNLPNFIGSDQQFDNDFQNFDLNGHNGEKFFAIGRPGNRSLALDDSLFSIVTNLTNDMIHNPRRSLTNDPDILTYPLNHVNLGTINGEIAVDIPTMPGISGAIAMQTFLFDNQGILQRVGRGYTVHWGSERIFIQQENQERISELKSIISRIN